MAEALPIRERILRQIKREFEKVGEGVGGHIVTWNNIKREPLESFDEIVGSTICILEGEEINSDEMGSTRKRLEVATEFWFTPSTGDEKAVEANLVLADVQKTLRSKSRLFEDDTTPPCQLAIDVQEIRNEIEIGEDNLIGGVVIWSVTFRHGQEDPAVLFGFS